jgi:hypothetical protein
MRYLFGRVTVNVSYVEAPDEKEAINLFKCPPEHVKKENISKKQNITFVMPWKEFPGDNPTVERDQVLASFLDLMASKIPFTSDAQPHPIIQVPEGSIVISEDTKISDHESRKD